MRAKILIAAFVVASTAAACQQPPDSDQATATFVACLERNGVEAQDVRVILGSDSSVESISLQILSEGDVAYEPSIRLACTQEVENS